MGSSSARTIAVVLLALCISLSSQRDMQSVWNRPRGLPESESGSLHLPKTLKMTNPRLNCDKTSYFSGKWISGSFVIQAVAAGGPDGDKSVESEKQEKVQKVCHETGSWYRYGIHIRDVRTFGSAEILGKGFYEATLFQRTCFKILSVDAKGKNLNEGCNVGPFYHVMINDTSGEIKQAAHVEYKPDESLHEACYMLALPRTFQITVHLVFANSVAVRNTIDEANNVGFARKMVVASSFVTPSPNPSMNVNDYWMSRPLCSFRVLSRTNNEGYWRKSRLQPFACRVHRITPSQIGKCLNGKRLLFLGDSQARYSFMHLMVYLRWKDRCEFLRNNPPEFHIDAAVLMKSISTEEGIFIDPLTKKVGKAVLDLPPTGSVEFFGRRYSGYAHARARVFKDGTSEAAAAFNMTYVVHIAAQSAAVKAWMNNASLLNGDPVQVGMPRFSHVFATTGLHDMAMSRRAEVFGTKLEKGMGPSVLELVRSPNEVTWFGIWSAQEMMKRWSHLYISNTVRSFSFEKTAKRVMAKLGVKQWIDVRYMTLARPDLCIDSTHYPFLISLATLELWLGALCPPPRLYGEERTKCF